MCINWSGIGLECWHRADPAVRRFTRATQKHPKRSNRHNRKTSDFINSFVCSNHNSPTTAQFSHVINNKCSCQDILSFSLKQMSAEPFVTVIKVIFYSFVHKSLWISRITVVLIHYGCSACLNALACQGTSRRRKKTYSTVEKAIS